MLNLLQFFTRHLTSFVTTFIIFSFVIVYLNPGPWMGLGTIVASYYLTNKAVKGIQLSKIYKRTGLTRTEYKHIETQLKKANEHINSLNQLYLRIRSITTFKKIMEMNRLAKTIVKIVKNDPKKFYQAEQFFYAHLDSAVQLTKQYTRLSTQPVKDKEIQIALADTRTTLYDLQETIQGDLKDVLSDDIENLKMEIEFAKLSNNKHKHNKQQLEWRGED